MSERLVKVVFLGLPIDVHRRAEEHQAILLRELAFVSAAEDPDGPFARLQALSKRIDGQFAGFKAQQEQELTAAIEAKADSVDICYEVPHDVVEAVNALATALDEVDELCRSGQLITLVTPPESLAYRRWILGELTRQVNEGAPPQPWSSALTAPRAPAGVSADGNGSRALEWQTVAVEGDLDLLGAVKLRNTLAALVEAGQLNLTIEMGHCDFIDSAGLSLLLTTRARCQNEGGSLQVTSLTHEVRRTMEIAEVLRLLTPASKLGTTWAATPHPD